jgi:hypothetical protein
MRRAAACQTACMPCAAAVTSRAAVCCAAATAGADRRSSRSRSCLVPSPLPSRPRHASSSSAAAAAPTPPPAAGRLEGAPLDARLDGLALLQQEFDVSGRALRMVCPADPDAVLDRYIEAGIDGDPYWTRVWPSAIALAHELLRRPELVAGLRVADLGGALRVGFGVVVCTARASSSMSRS